MLLNNQCITEESKSKKKTKNLETNDNKHTASKTDGHGKSSSKREFTAIPSYLRKQEVS